MSARRALGGALWFFSLALLTACSNEPVASDAGGLDDAGDPPCTADDECDDAVFCNGEETCAPSAADADEHGCVRGGAACPTGQSCDEDTDTCTPIPCAMPDADGDGQRAMECGGGDCDDSDPERYPGATEICDTRDHDEDCDPRTFGFRDGDRDSHPDALCCNEDEDGTRHCGDDCDDARPDRYEGLLEACDGTDNDCDDRVDEGADADLYRDADGDDFGDPDHTTRGCPGRVEGYVLDGTDCDDARAATHPGATDECNGIDDDCSLPVDPPTCACRTGETLPCGYSSGAADRCRVVMGTCRMGVLDCPAGLITGRELEVCNGVDDNCDGMIDTPVTPPSVSGLPRGQCYSGRAGTLGVGACHAGTYACTGSGGWTCMGEVVPQDGTAVQCGVDLDCDGNRYENVECTAGTTMRTATLCTSSELRCSQTCQADCRWPTDCVMSQTFWHFMAPAANVELECAYTCPDYGVCANDPCFDGRNLLGTAPLNLPPGTYTADAWMGGSPGTAVDFFASTWDGVTVLGGRREVFDSTGALHTVTMSFTIPAGVGIPGCNPPISVHVAGRSSAAYFRLTDIVIRWSGAPPRWPG